MKSITTTSRSGLVAEVEGDKVRLSARGDVAASLFEQEQSGEPIGPRRHRDLIPPSFRSNGGEGE